MSERIEIVKLQRPVRVEVDMDKLTWADALQMNQYRAKAAAGEMSDDEATALLNQLVEKVTGQNPLTMPSAVVGKIVAAIFGDDEGEDSKNSVSG